ncbi:response regulator transcription factor [Pseudoxanthobacter sp. M-2]|uniref:response regulator n=1 Tax=Pseudoxanthobacter sp. M-2 TaxID=3078754 RepID=UPI0038FC2326
MSPPSASQPDRAPSAGAGSSSPHVLVVDDDAEIRTLLGRYLAGQGFRVSLAADRRALEAELVTAAIDLVVLDVLLPDGSGLDICRELKRRRPALPIILLTALKEEVDRIIGLEIGADDYLGKPFNPRELVARIRAVLRRGGEAAAAPSARRWRFAGFQADAASRAVFDADGAAIDLTGAEFDLLRVLLDRPGRVLSRDQLLDLTQGRDADPLDRSIDVLVSRLRRKLGDAPPFHMVKTVRNGGYQFAARVETEGEVP